MRCESTAEQPVTLTEHSPMSDTSLWSEPPPLQRRGGLPYVRTLRPRATAARQAAHVHGALRHSLIALMGTGVSFTT